MCIANSVKSNQLLWERHVWSGIHSVQHVAPDGALSITQFVSYKHGAPTVLRDVESLGPFTLLHDCSPI